MIRKILFIFLIGNSIIANAQNKISIKNNKRFGIYAGIGITNAFENNTVNNWPKFTNIPFTIESKPSLEFGISYTLPLVENLLSLKSELGILTGKYVQKASFQGYLITYDNHFETLNLKGLAELKLPLNNNSELIIFGLGPGLNFTSSTSQTDQTILSYSANYKYNIEYSNKFFLGAKAYLGLAKNNSVIKFDYNWVKMSSSNRDIPFAPFYTFGITYEHKIF